MSYCRTIPPKTKTRRRQDRRQPQNQSEMANYPYNTGRQSSSSSRRLGGHRQHQSTMPYHNQDTYGYNGASTGYRVAEPRMQEEEEEEEDQREWEEHSNPPTVHQQYPEQLHSDDQYGATARSTVMGGVHHPAKYEKMKHIAQTEEEMFEAHKARKKEKIVQEFCYDQEPQIVGGSNRTDKQVSDLRKEQEQKMKRAKIQKKIDEEERKKQARQKEQAENDKHKQQQREKAEKLEERKKQEKQVDLDELRRMRLLRFS